MAAIINNEENCHCDDIKQDCKDFEDVVVGDDNLNADVKDNIKKIGKKKKNKKNKNNDQNCQQEIENDEDQEIEINKGVDEELKCPRCHNMFDIPLLLPCMHFFCLK